jgi:hypothetical protein
MHNLISSAFSRAFARRPAGVHFHLDFDGDRVCEDTSCPHRTPNAARSAAGLDALRRSGI